MEEATQIGGESSRNVSKKLPKVALVHDFLLAVGGAEKVLEVLARMYPDAPIYTLLYDEDGMGGMFGEHKVQTSFLQKLPKWWHKHLLWLLPLLPTAPETFDLRQYDVVISSSGAWSKGIVTRVTTTHVAYIHSPMRFVWDQNIRYAKQRTGKKLGYFAQMLMSYLRVWDFEAAQRPDTMIANSRYTAARITKFYRRDSSVVYPPIEIDEAEIVSADKRKHFLVVSRLSEYKQVSLAVEVCTRLELPLVVVGAGREFDNLRKLAGPTVRIAGFVSDERLARYYANARALLFGAEDDFGMVMAEALGAGTPVIAYERGGAREIVTAGETGELFGAQTPEVFADGIRRFLLNEGNYDQGQMRAKAQEFSTETFKQKIQEIVDKI